MKPTLLDYDKNRTLTTNGYLLSHAIWLTTQRYKLEGCCFDMATEEGTTKPVFYPGWDDAAQTDAEGMMSLADSHGMRVEIWENIEEYPRSVSCRLVKVDRDTLPKAAVPCPAKGPFAVYDAIDGPLMIIDGDTRVMLDDLYEYDVSPQARLERMEWIASALNAACDRDKVRE